MIHLADRPAAKSRLKRRGFPIHAYVGPNGHGKTLAMVYDTLPTLEIGRPVLSTVRLLDYRNPRDCPGGDACDDLANHEITRRRPVLVEETGALEFISYKTGQIHAASHPFYVRFTDYSQLLNWSDGDVLMDEVTGVASSREVASMPVQVANYLVQLRRRNVSLRWTAPAWGRADKIIREVSQAVTLCLGSFSKRRPSEPGSPPRLWADRRLFNLRTFDAALMDEFEARRADGVVPEINQWWWRPGCLAPDAYDTLDPVTALGWANDAGLCMVCGGKRMHPKCGCEDHGKLKAKTTGLEAIGGRPQAEPMAVPLSDPRPGPGAHALR